ncbi:paralemmin-3 [Amia ocellicauda]|uniref:paralemmin-3 n=1 Tax=Amia ocellicauda TaxID=2972642 RepID=UPI003464D1B2
MDEAEKYQQRLQAIAEKRRLQEEEERARREMEEERLRLQQLKRKSLRDQWLMEGPPLTPEPPSPRSPLWSPPVQQTEDKLPSQASVKDERKVNQVEETRRLKDTAQSGMEAAKTGTEEPRADPTPVQHSVTPEPPKPVPRVRRVPPAEDTPLENGQGTRTVLSTMAVTVEKDHKTGATVVHSVVPLSTEDVQLTGEKVFDDGRKTVHAVGVAVGMPSPEEVGLVLSAISKKATEEPKLEELKTEPTVIQNGDARSPEPDESVPAVENSLTGDAHSLPSSHSPPQSHHEGKPETNGPVGASESAGDESPEEPSAEAAQGDSQPPRQETEDVSIRGPEDMGGLGEGAVTLTFLGFSEAGPEEEIEGATGAVIRAERVIITEEGDELPVDPGQREEEPLKDISAEQEPPQESQHESVEGPGAAAEPPGTDQEEPVEGSAAATDPPGPAREVPVEATKAELELPMSSTAPPQEEPSPASTGVTSVPLEQQQQEVLTPGTGLPVDSEEPPAEKATAASQLPLYSQAAPSHAPRSEREPDKQKPESEKNPIEKEAPENTPNAAAAASLPEQFQDVPLDGVGDLTVSPEGVKLDKPELQPLLNKGQEVASSSKRSAPARPAELQPLLQSSSPQHNSAKHEQPSAGVKSEPPTRAEAEEPPRPKTKTCQCCSVM